MYAPDISEFYPTASGQCDTILTDAKVYSHGESQRGWRGIQTIRRIDDVPHSGAAPSRLPEIHGGEQTVALTKDFPESSVGTSVYESESYIWTQTTLSGASLHAGRGSLMLC